MGYQLFDKNNKELNYHDLQHKSFWCKDGEENEDTFVRLYGQKLGLTINPEKKTNPYAPDLLNIANKKLGDLKYQSTPFFKANTLYKLDPTYTVVFNLKDKLRYEQNYPDIEIYFWVNWIALKFKMGSIEINVEPTNGIWKVDFINFVEYLGKCPMHNYMQRTNDTQGNAKSSYVCDLRSAVFKRLA